MIINRGGRELNPILRGLMSRVGLVGGLVITKGWLIGMILAAASFDQAFMLYGFAGIYIAVCAWNIHALKSI